MNKRYIHNAFLARSHAGFYFSFPPVFTGFYLDILVVIIQKDVSMKKILYDKANILFRGECI